MRPVTPSPHRPLKSRLHAGVTLIDRYVRAYLPDLTAIDATMVAALQHWATVSTSALSEHLSDDTVLQCGSLRRDPDGSWWWCEHFLGRDNDPAPALAEFESSARTVRLLLGEALQRAAEALDRADDGAAARAARHVRQRYDHWTRTGVW